MDDTERGVGADFDLLVAIPPDEASSGPTACGEAERSGPPRAARRWSADERARIVRESFRPGERVSDVARRYGLSGKQLSSWRALARECKLTLPSSAGPDPEPVAAACESEGEPSFAALAVEPDQLRSGEPPQPGFRRLLRLRFAGYFR